MRHCYVVVAVSLKIKQLLLLKQAHTMIPLSGVVLKTFTIKMLMDFLNCSLGWDISLRNMRSLKEVFTAA